MAVYDFLHTHFGGVEFHGGCGWPSAGGSAPVFERNAVSVDGVGFDGLGDDIAFVRTPYAYTVVGHIIENSEAAFETKHNLIRGLKGRKGPLLRKREPSGDVEQVTARLVDFSSDNQTPLTNARRYTLNYSVFDDHWHGTQRTIPINGSGSYNLPNAGNAVVRQAVLTTNTFAGGLTSMHFRTVFNGRTETALSWTGPLQGAQTLLIDFGTGSIKKDGQPTTGWEFTSGPDLGPDTHGINELIRIHPGGVDLEIEMVGATITGNLVYNEGWH